jgi:hypothetical protein
MDLKILFVTLRSDSAQEINKFLRQVRETIIEEKIAKANLM